MAPQNPAPFRHDFDEVVERRGTGSVKWNRYSPDVLPMWVADSDFKAPAPVLEVLRMQAERGIFGYTDGFDCALERAAAHWMSSRFGWQVDPDEVSFSPGVSATLAVAITTFAAPGESVLMFTPTYPPFYNLTRLNGRKVLGSSLLPGANGAYAIDWPDLEAKMARPDVRLMLLCNPQNPTGRVFARAELERLGELCLRHGVTMLSDEIHCDFIAPGHAHIPFASLSPEISAITLTGVSPSKTFNIAGLKSAAVISTNADLLARFKETVHRNALEKNTAGLLAFHAAYTRCAYYADQIAAYVRANQELAVGFINKEAPGIAAYLPEGTYLLWLNCGGLGLTQPDLERFFLEKAKLGLNSGTDFGPEGQGYMRMNLACPKVTVIEAMRRLKAACAAEA